MKDILLISTGGTIACVETDRGLRPGLSGDELLAFVPQARELCRLDTLDLFDVDSTNVTPSHWLAMARAIAARYDSYDGFVIAHGTDTLAYTAAGLSYLVQRSPKPIVVTGAQLPMNNTLTDAKANLYHSLQYAACDASCDVTVVFGGVAIAGTRATKRRTSSARAFESVNFPELAAFRHGGIVCTGSLATGWPDGGGTPADAGMRDTPPADAGCGAPDSAAGGAAGIRAACAPDALQLTGAPRFYDNLNPRVGVLKLVPGLDPAVLDALAPHLDAVVVEGFGLGGIPSAPAYRDAVFRWLDSGRMMIAATQAFEEGFDMTRYEVGRAYVEHGGMLMAGDMTCEAMVAKAMWALGQADDGAQVAQLFNRPVNFDRTMF